MCVRAASQPPAFSVAQMSGAIFSHTQRIDSVSRHISHTVLIVGCRLLRHAHVGAAALGAALREPALRAGPEPGDAEDADDRAGAAGNLAPHPGATPHFSSEPKMK
jgi:hypothetical protein